MKRKKLCVLHTEFQELLHYDPQLLKDFIGMGKSQFNYIFDECN